MGLATISAISQAIRKEEERHKKKMAELKKKKNAKQMKW